MFTPLILACTTSVCIAIGGPAQKTEDDCHRSVVERGALFVAQRYPQYKMIDYKCIAWGEPA